MKLRLIGDRVAVKRSTEVADRTAGGIILPDVSKEKPLIGTVISVGDGRIIGDTVFPLRVKEGDTVMFGKYSGSEQPVDGENYIIMREDEIIGVLE